MIIRSDIKPTNQHSYIVIVSSTKHKQPRPQQRWRDHATHHHDQHDNRSKQRACAHCIRRHRPRHSRTQITIHDEIHLYTIDTYSHNMYVCICCTLSRSHRPAYICAWYIYAIMMHGIHIRADAHRVQRWGGAEPGLLRDRSSNYNILYIVYTVKRWSCGFIFCTDKLAFEYGTAVYRTVRM